jgi:hypothetical protein
VTVVNFIEKYFGNVSTFHIATGVSLVVIPTVLSLGLDFTFQSAMGFE